MRRKSLLLMFCTIALIISIIAVGTSPSSPEAFFSVDPPMIVDTSLVPGETFSININITNVIDLTGYEFKLGYNTTILNATKITIGTFFSQYKVWTNKTYEDEGYVHLAVSLPLKIPPLPGVSGNGTLAKITFTVDGYGESVLDLYETGLVNSKGYPIPHEAYDGYFSNAGFCTPVAAFTFDPKKPVAGRNVTFNASASYDIDGEIVSYEWDFGDGEVVSETDPIIVHTYASNGTYNVTLTVTDDDGITDTTTKDVQVDLRDIALNEIKVHPTVIPTGESAVINITIVNEGTTREWFNVTAYYENATVKYPIWYNKTANQKAFSLKGQALPPGEKMNVTFTWTTTDIVGTRIYRISANACLVDYEGNFIPDESDTTNNARSVDVTVKAPHDIAVKAVKASLKAVIIGESISINVTVQNEGTNPETFNVTVYYDSSIIDTHTDLSLDADSSKTLIFTWNTTGVAEDEYTISATATIVDGEEDRADNEFINGKVRLSEKAVHDIAITDVSADPTSVIVGASISINITVNNLGTEQETFNVILYYDGNNIGVETMTNLASGADKTLTFIWDTLGVPAGIYTIKAVVPPVPEETDTTDNIFTDVTVTLTVKVTEHIKVVGGATFRIVIESNSDVSDLAFDQAGKEISFKVKGELAISFCNVTIPKDLLNAPPDQWIVLVDGKSETPSVTYNATHTFLYFTFNLSVRSIQIIGTTVATKPVANFVVLPTKPIIGELVTFNASASYDEDGFIVRYKWNFGDGNITTVANPVITHIYSSAGTYTTTLTVKDDDGLSSEPAQKPISVLQPPTANFTYSPKTAIFGEALTFNATMSYDLDGAIVSYRWDFGDGNITTVANPVITHIYKAPSTYNVNLTVTDNDQLTDTITSYVTVLLHDIFVTIVTAMPTTVTAGESISINVKVVNRGNFSETFDVSVYYNGNILDTQMGITLSAGADATLTFSWDTTNVLSGNYTISAKASVVPKETDTANNTYINGTVEVKETPPPTTVPIILYVAAVFTIVIIIATIVIYFFRFRKS